MDKITFDCEDGSTVDFYIVDEARIGGFNYILVKEDEDDEADCYIMKDISDEGENDACYEFVEEEAEFEAVRKVFEEQYNLDGQDED